MKFKRYKLIFIFFGIIGVIWLFVLFEASKFPEAIIKPSDQERKFSNQVWDDYKSHQKLSTENQKILLNKLVSIEPHIRSYSLKGYPIIIDLAYRCLAPYHIVFDVSFTGDINGKPLKAFRQAFIKTALQKINFYSIKPFWNEQSTFFSKIESNQLTEKEYTINLKFKLSAKGRLKDWIDPTKILATKEYQFQLKTKVVSQLPENYFKKNSDPQLDKSIKVMIQADNNNYTEYENGKVFKNIILLSKNILPENLSYHVTVLEKNKIITESDALAQKGRPLVHSFSPFSKSMNPALGEHQLKIVLEPSEKPALKQSATINSYWNKKFEKNLPIKVYQRK